jgi:hypothetical protein
MINENKIKDILELEYLNIMYSNDSHYEATPEKATYIDVAYKTIDKYEIPSFKLPKKEIDTEWILNKISNHINRKMNYKRLFDGLNIGGNFYNTTYGVGIFMPSWCENQINELKTRLDSLNIKYTTQYSEAHWVYRFKFSKEQSNLELINNLLK